jgi:hypothetical protein
VGVQVSSSHSKLSDDGREYYLEGETSKFDGTGFTPNNH